MNFLEYLRKLDNDEIDELIAKATLIARYEKQFGKDYCPPSNEFDHLMNVSLHELNDVIRKMIASI